MDDTDNIPHGTYSGYNKHNCRCYPCRIAGRAYAADYYADNKANGPRLVDATPARKHLSRWCKSTGQGLHSFSRASGVSLRNLQRIRNGCDRVRKETEAAILSVPVSKRVLAVNVVPSLVYRRKVEALVAIGYGSSALAKSLGYQSRALQHAITRPTITLETAAKIDGLFDRLSAHPRFGTHAAEQARRLALRRGYVPPLAWDDIENDPHPRGVRPTQSSRPSHEVDTVRVERLLAHESVPDSTKAEKVEAMRRWLASGRSERSLCKIHGWHDGRYSQALEDGAA